MRRWSASSILTSRSAVTSRSTKRCFRSRRPDGCSATNPRTVGATPVRRHSQVPVRLANPPDEAAVKTSSFLQLSDQLLDPLPDLIADGSNDIDALSGRIVESPVLVAFAGIVRAGVTAAHGDHHVRGLDSVVGEDLGFLGTDVDAFLGHRL